MMLSFGLKFITTVCFVSNIGILCINYQCWAEESPHEKGCKKNVCKGSLNFQNEMRVLSHIIRKRNTDYKPDMLNLPLDNVPESEMANDPESANIDMFSDVPYTTPVNRANLYTKSKNSKPSVKKSEKRNNRLSKSSQSKSKSGLDDINGKVLPLDCGCWKLPSVQKSQQKSQETINENPYIPCNINPADPQRAFKNFKNGVNEMGQISKIKKINDYIDTIPKNVHLAADGNNEKHILQKILLPSDCFGTTKKEIIDIESRNSILPEGLTEILREQNSILKEILLKIDHYDIITGQASPGANDRSVNVILDMKNIGNRSFDLELNPIIKFSDEYDQSNSNLDKNWVKTSRDSTSKIDVKMNGGKQVFNSYGQNTYVPFSYSDPLVNMASQIPNLNWYKPSKSPWSYAYRQQNNTPYIINDVYLSKTNKKNTMSAPLNDIVSFTPQFNHHEGYIKSPNYLPRTKPYHKPRYPNYALQYKYV